MEERALQRITGQNTDPAFLKTIARTNAGKKILNCIQCGVCAGSCHARFAMDYSPMQIIKMTQLGLRDDVLSSATIWVCASCYTCTSRCPQGIDIPLLMSALKNTAIENNVPAKIPMKPAFHKAFSAIVRQYGRMHEPELHVKLMDKSNVKGLLSNAAFGWKMWRKGKVKLSASRIDRTVDIQAIFEAASKKEEEQR